MYEIIYSKRFRFSYKKLKKSGSFNDEKFSEIIKKLAMREALPDKFHDHILKGNLQDRRECHLDGTILLVYRVNDLLKVVTLTEIGTHSQLFGR